MNILERYEKGTPDNKVEERTFAFLNELSDRAGFDEWWSSIDEPIKIEILESLVESVGKIH